MSIEAAIIAAWGSYSPLTALVPVARAQPGVQKSASDQDFPYVGLLRTGGTVQRTSSNRIKTSTLAITIRDTDFDRAEKVRKVIEDYFDRGEIVAGGW